MLRQRSEMLVAEGDTTGAVAALDAALLGPWTSPEALLAQGRLHVARGDAGRAVLALERASRLAPTDPDVAAARREAYALAGQVAPRVPPPLVASRAVLARVGAGALVALALVLYLGAVALGLAWRRRQRPLAGWSALALAPLALAALVLAGVALWDAGRPRAVTLAAVDVKARPTPEAEGAGALRAGEVVRVGEARGLWRRVEAGDAEGWVPARAVERL